MSAFVRVIIDRSIRRELDYSVPETLADKVVVGHACSRSLSRQIASRHRRRHPRRKPGRRDQTDRGVAGRKARPEREPDRTGALDGELLLLPDRNRDAKSAPAGHPARGGRLEETAFRWSGAHRDAGGDRETAQARTASGGIAGSDHATPRADAGGGPPAPDFAR